MKVTERDRRVVADLALSHVLSRDQILGLDYFSSIGRLNTRLRELAAINLVRKLETPFFNQSLYMAGPLAHEVVAVHVSRLLESRLHSPRFVRHALSVTNVRIALCQKGHQWRFEQQLWRQFSTTRAYESRPDGLVLTASEPIFVEVDLGHVAPTKFKEKLLGYEALAESGKCQELYGFSSFRLLTVTTGTLRARRLCSLLPNPRYDHCCQTFEQIGAQPILNWS